MVRAKAKRGKPQRTPSCWICRATLGRGEVRQCKRCDEIYERMATVHGYAVKTKCMGPGCLAYRAAREAEQAERIAREMEAK